MIVSENRSYGSIRIHQERDYPGRTIGTDLHNPRLELIGEAYGFAVSVVASRDELARLRQALAAPGPQFVLVKSSLESVLPRRAAAPAGAQQP